MFMQTNIPTNLQGNIEQVRLVQHNYNTECTSNDLQSHQ